MHRRLAIGVAFAAAVIDAIGLVASGLFAFWPKQVANPTSIIVDVALLLLAPVALGVIAAVAASKLDPRIYDGADVERLLGVAPMGDLPDFAEAPGEYSEVDLLRLANEIAHLCKKGQTRRCVFTGTGHGAGVTTVAGRVKEALNLLDRPAMLVDATGAPLPGIELTVAALQAAGLAEGVGRADEGGRRRDELILTDAGPITTSPDTEYLARFADSVFVVIESGVTTRRELHRTVSCLQKLNVSGVRFVVNRVKQSHSGRRLSEPVAALGIAPGQFAAAVRRSLADPPHQDEESSRPPRAAAETGKTAKAPKEPETPSSMMWWAPQPSAWNAPGVPPWLADALAQLERKVAERSAEQARATPGGAKSPQQLSAPDQVPAAESTEPAVRQFQALPLEDHSKGKESHLSEAEAMLFSMDLNLPKQENEPMAPTAGAENAPPEGQRAEKRPSRLSGLRGMVTVADLRALSQPKQAEATRWPVADPHQGVPSSLIGALTETPGRLTGLKGLVTPADLRELNQARPQANGAGDHAQAPAQKTMAREPRIVEVAHAPKTDEGPANAPEPAVAKNAKFDAVLPKPPESVRPERDVLFDEVLILPSKRGQYLRKN
jgi:hypothetical protein